MPGKSKRKVRVSKSEVGGFLTSAGKVLDALDLLCKLPSISVTELAGKKKIPMSTAYRSLATLSARGYAVQLKDRRYYPGPKLKK